MKFSDIKKFIEENELSEDTEIFVFDNEDGSVKATELTIENEMDVHFRMKEPRLLIQ